MIRKFARTPAWILLPLAASLCGSAAAQTPDPQRQPGAQQSQQTQTLEMFAQSATPIANLKDDYEVTVAGSVTEIYGDNFILQDNSGKVMCDRGPRGADQAPVKIGDKITVEGHFKGGTIKVWSLTPPDGKRIMVGGSVQPNAPPVQGVGAAPQESPVEERVIAAAKAKGYKDPVVIDVKPDHAEIMTRNAKGELREVHLDFSGNVMYDKPHIQDLSSIDADALMTKHGYVYDGQMYPVRKETIVRARRRTGERVNIQVHPDGTIGKISPVFDLEAR